MKYTLLQWKVLYTLEEFNIEGITPTTNQLARKKRYNYHSVWRALNVFMEKEFVSSEKERHRTRGPGRTEQSIYTITDKGVEALRDIERFIREEV